MLYYQAIPSRALELLKNIQKDTFFSHLRLVGGTSLAMQIGHRLSVDLDLFGEFKHDVLSLEKKLSSLGALELLTQTENIHIYSLEGVKVDIVNYHYPWLKPGIQIDGLLLCSIEDIAAMKLAAITGRGSKKDFIDIYFILQKYSLKEILGFYEDKYKDGSLFLVLRSLVYFSDAEEDVMPKMLMDVSWEEVKNFIEKTLKSYEKTE